MKKTQRSGAGVAREFEAYLKRTGKSRSTVYNYMYVVRSFLRYAGEGRRPDSIIGSDTVKKFFETVSVSSRRIVASRISTFLKFVAERYPAVPAIAQRARRAALESPKADNSLAQTWSIDRLQQQKETDDDLIAKLGRKVIDCYLYLQSRIKGEPENLDDLHRIADECKNLIESNLALFMKLSAEGRNVHSKIDRRVQR